MGDVVIHGLFGVLVLAEVLRAIDRFFADRGANWRASIALAAVAYEAAEDERRWREFDAQLEQASVSLAKRINDAFAAQEQATARRPCPKCKAARQAAKGN